MADKDQLGEDPVPPTHPGALTEAELDEVAAGDPLARFTSTPFTSSPIDGGAAPVATPLTTPTFSPSPTPRPAPTALPG